MALRTRDLFARTRTLIRPHALSVLGRLPATAGLAGFGHILMFHRVIPRSRMSGYGMAAFEITPQNLEFVVGFFRRRGYRVISLDEMLEAYASGSFDRKFIVMTFDDGYKDTLSVAYPILKKLHAPFTIYITTGYVDREAVKWDYLAEAIVDKNDGVTIEGRDGSTLLDCSTPERKRRSCDTLQDYLFDLNVAGFGDKICSFVRRYGFDPYSKTDELMLDWEQLKEMVGDPLVTIGSHSVNHHALSRLGSFEARNEIAESKRRLEEVLGVEIGHFSYPYGRAHEAGRREFEMVIRSGYKTATTGVKGNLFPEHGGRLAHLPRYCVGSNCSAAHLSAIANGFLSLIANRLARIS